MMHDCRRVFRTMCYRPDDEKQHDDTAPTGNDNFPDIISMETEHLQQQPRQPNLTTAPLADAPDALRGRANTVFDCSLYYTSYGIAVADANNARTMPKEDYTNGKDNRECDVSKVCYICVNLLWVWVCIYIYIYIYIRWSM
jgi:hypothetical protein